MPDPNSYYWKNREARQAYQREYYKQFRNEVRRQKELTALLEPEKHERYLEYQKSYYYKHREKLLKARRDRYYKKQARERAQRNENRNPESGDL